MIRNTEAESTAFGDDDEYYGRLNLFNRFCLKRIRVVFWIILSIPCNCCSFFKYLTSSIKEMHFRQYIAVVTLVLSASIFPTSIIVLRGNERIITAIYCLPFIVCSFLSLLFKRGWVIIGQRSRSELLERQQLLANHRRGRNDQHAGYGEKDKRQRLQRTLENLMEPRQDTFLHSESEPVIYINRTNSCTPIKCCDESSAGPSHAPECTNRFTITHFSDGSYDSEESPQRLSEARISASVVKTFGLPFQVFGADSFRVLSHSSDENCSSDESVVAKVKEFEVPVEVHHSDSYRPLNSGNVGLDKPGSVTNYENVIKNGSTLFSNLLYVDDDNSSEPTCSKFQNDVKNEESG